MKNQMLLFLLLILSTGLKAQVMNGEVIGTVVDSLNSEEIIGAEVFILDQDRKYQCKTNFEGRFHLTDIPAGTYVLHVRYFEDTMSTIVANVPMDGVCNLGTIHFSAVKTLLTIEYKIDPNEIRLVSGSLPIPEIKQEDIKHSPDKFNIKGLVVANNSDVRQTDDGELVFRGSRKGDMLYYIDGIKQTEVYNVPSSSISRMMVYTGGLPAKFGDTTGGVIVVETASYFELYRKWQLNQ